MLLTDVALVWDDLVVADDVNEHPNGGALAVISASLGKVEGALEKVAQEQSSQREYLARFDERQRGWATKHEVGELVISIRGDMSKIEAKADRALIRTDESSAALSMLGASMERLREEVQGVRSDFTTRTAEVRGATTILRPTLAWMASVAAVIASAVIGHFVI